jgi:hypothetical protein
MSFIFKISRVDRFTDINVGVLDGELTRGKVNGSDQAHLLHAGQRFKVRLAGLLHGAMRGHDYERISLSIDLRQPGMHLVRAGDILISE